MFVLFGKWEIILECISCAHFLLCSQSDQNLIVFISFVSNIYIPNVRKYKTEMLNVLSFFKMEKREPNYRRDEESYKQPDTFSYGQSTYSAQYPYRPDVYKTSRARQIVQPTSLFGNNERKLAELYKETEVLVSVDTENIRI